MSDEWCTIESDPGVFTELLEEMGVSHVELDELYSMDDDSLTTLQDTGDVYGLIFLFKWKPGTSTSLGDRTPLQDYPQDLFFAKQVTHNACATQAILSVVFNSNIPNIGSTLEEFKSFTASFPPDLKGEAIGASDELRKTHNAFGRKDAFLQEGRRTVVATGDEDLFHFVAYIPFQDKVYELDGLQSGPILISTENDENWMTVARTAIQQRMESLGGEEIKFNLMAVIRDRRVGLEEKLSCLENKDSPEYHQVEAELAAEHAKRHEWKLENERRRHNYVPLCLQLLKELGKSGALPQLVEEANERVEAKRAKKAEKAASEAKTSS